MFWNDRNRSDPAPPPLPNSYWVQPGRLLAGEYPGAMSRVEAMERIQALLRAGVTSFIDLTEEGELPEYDALLLELTEQRIHYRRLPVLDHSVPRSAAHMGQIVDAIEAELVGGHCVYVHCHAGIGRTGMAIACHLVRSGLANEAALEQLQTLWRRCARSRRWPNVPETDEQVEFVRQWRDTTRSPGAAPASTEARFEGALTGLAFGDALGALVATSRFDAATVSAVMHASTGPLDAGLHTGAHTAMTRAVAESLLAIGTHDAADQMQRYLQWTRTAVGASIPAELKRALAAWQWSKKPNAGTHDPRNLDPHSLPRTLAVAMFMHAEVQGAIDAAAGVSRSTQQAPIVLDLCRVWGGLLIDALAGVSKDELHTFAGPAMQHVRQRALKPQVKGLIAGREGNDLNESDALGVTRAALRSFASAHTFRDALLNVVTTTPAPSTAAALCGALCGAHYGLEAIPLEWRRRLGEDATLRSLAHRLLT
ncbi:MAG: ADP-ribosylglycohydrolase family protein [Steroidobacter sp.]